MVGHQGVGIPSRRRQRRSRSGVGSPARSARWVLQLDPLPQTCSETSSSTRRDTRFRPARLAASQLEVGGSLKAQWAQPSKLVLAKREVDAKWPRVRPPIIKTKQHVTAIHSLLLTNHS